MTISLKHSFTSPKADGTDSTLVQPSNWNAEHTITLGAGKVLGRDSSAAGAMQELPISVDAAGQSMIPPAGTTAQRPATPVAGMFRYNTTLAKIELYNGSAWGSVGGGAAVGSTAPPTPAPGDLWYNTVSSTLEMYDGTNWIAVSAGLLIRQTFTASASQSSFTITGGYTVGQLDVYMNGIKLVVGTDVTASTGTTIVLATPATAGDIIEIVGFSLFTVANAFPATGGTISGDLTVSGILTSSNNLIANNVSVSGNQTFTGPSARFIGDFSNATTSVRAAFQTNSTNSSTGIYALPNGTSTAASWQALNSSDPTNASKVLIATNGSSDVQLVSGRNGTGAFLPLTFYTGGGEGARLDTSSNWYINSGYGSPAITYGCRAWVQFDNTGTITGQGNVSSVTKNASGTYTINFLTSMPDTAYSVGGSARRSSGNSDMILMLAGADIGKVYSTTQCKVITRASDFGLSEPDLVNIQVVR